MFKINPMKLTPVFSKNGWLTPLLVVALHLSACAQKTGTEPWTASQLMAPQKLATLISDNKAAKPVIYSIGPGAVIKGSIDIGMVNNTENLNKLKQQLSKLPKTTAIVIYCGCCPFEHCPNIRPAFTLLNDLKFTNARLLNLPTNIKVDWIDKGYPEQ